MVTKHGMGLNKHSSSVVLSQFDESFSCFCLPAIFYKHSSLFWHVQHINSVCPVLKRSVLRHHKYLQAASGKTNYNCQIPATCCYTLGCQIWKQFLHCFVLLKHFNIHNYFNCRSSIVYQGDSTRPSGG